MVAMPPIRRPKLLTADELITALDLAVQAWLLGLLAEPQRDVGAAIMFSAHNPGATANFGLARIAKRRLAAIRCTAPLRSALRSGCGFAAPGRAHRR
jgi:ABC-type dipeptide/oligopeptide/nickel transport system ATPase subunit